VFPEDLMDETGHSWMSGKSRGRSARNMGNMPKGRGMDRSQEFLGGSQASQGSGRIGGRSMGNGAGMSGRGGDGGGGKGAGFPGLSTGKSGRMNHESQDDFGARGVKNFKAKDYENDSF
jgi:hypothetical protein